ncbi:hypothetical protein EVAR_58507_1 [Eumeta japonica]|uniref:Uncharacterized protein n=1 Tax=Eumeta variegata TaxID=151549 RepID=A0A4C1ZBB9_EUMVA|nr:hypothetical protein EVAR_58507_1 [Eumeta japonica]
MTLIAIVLSNPISLLVSMPIRLTLDVDGGPAFNFEPGLDLTTPNAVHHNLRKDLKFRSGTCATLEEIKLWNLFVYRDKSDRAENSLKAAEWSGTREQFDFVAIPIVQEAGGAGAGPGASSPRRSIADQYLRNVPVMIAVRKNVAIITLLTGSFGKKRNDRK